MGNGVIVAVFQEATEATESIREEFEGGGAEEAQYLQKINRGQALLATVCATVVEHDICHFV